MKVSNLKAIDGKKTNLNISILKRFKYLFSNPVLAAIREGLSFSLPVIVAGTMAVLVQSFPLNAYQNLMKDIFGENWNAFPSYIWNGTLGFISVIMTISISTSLSEHFNSLNPSRRTNTSIASIIAVCCLIITMEPGQLFNPDSTSMSGEMAMPAIWFGVHGLLWATFIALCSSSIFHWLLGYKRLRLIFYSSSSDTAMSQAIDTLIPGVLTILIFATIKTVLLYFGISDINAALYRLISLPFSNMSDNMLQTASLYGVARHLLWFFGIHGSNVLEPVMTELFRPGVAANQAALAVGMVPTEIFTKPFFDFFTSIGGSGSTMGLLIACLIWHRDPGTKKIARISIAPAIFNINEILLFGLPVVLNPVYLIPFILVPLVQTIVSYLAFMSGLVPLVANDVAWNTPIFLSGYMSTESIAGIILQALCLTISVFIYMPFVKLDNLLKAEQFDNTFKKLIKVTSEGETPKSYSPRFLSSPDTVGSLARVLALDLERGLKSNEFYLEYQPQVNSDTGQVYGVEALTRWRHPEIGMVPPPVFIGLAEDTGFIETLGLWVIEEGCKQAAIWQKSAGAEHVTISVNVSARQLEDPLLPDKVADLLKKYNLKPHRIKIEVTESIAIGGSHRHKVLEKFNELGLKLAIDDFGMGHTSLSYLKEFKVDSLKLDSILSRDVLDSRSSQEIVTTIADLCRSLEITLIAEFVEDEKHLLKLRELGCQNIQGYYYSPPLLPEPCLEFITRKHKSFADASLP